MKLWSWFDLHKSPSGVLSSSSYLNLTELSELQKCMVYSCFTCMCWPSETNQCYPPPPPSFLSCLVLLLILFLVFFDLLQGSHQSFGCRAAAQPFGGCGSNGRRSVLKPTGSPRGCSRTPSTSSHFARPASQPRNPETCPGAHPHHSRANPLLSLLTHNHLTSASQEHPLQKHTVKLQTWSTNSNWWGGGIW